MATYPASTYAPRTKANKAGVVYDPTKSTIGYVEDVTKLDDEVVAIETELGLLPKGTSASILERIKGIRSLSDAVADTIVIKGGKVGIGTDAPSTVLDILVTDAAGVAQLTNTDSSVARYPGFGIVNYTGASGGGHPFNFFNNAAGTKASPSALLPSKPVGLFVFQAHDGTSFKDVARFGGYTGPNFAAGDLEGYIFFSTTDGTTSAERMRINHLGNVGIGTNSPNANAILDVASTTKAFMPPRMTTAQRDAIASPTEGMVIFNITTHVLNFYYTSWGAV